MKVYKAAWVLMFISGLLFAAGCNSPLRPPDKGEEVLKKQLQDRFKNIYIGDGNNYYYDTVDKRMWVRFQYTESPVEVRYIEIQAEKVEQKGDTGQ